MCIWRAVIAFPAGSCLGRSPVFPCEAVDHGRGIPAEKDAVGMRFAQSRSGLSATEDRIGRRRRFRRRPSRREATRCTASYAYDVDRLPIVSHPIRSGPEANYRPAGQVMIGAATFDHLPSRAAADKACRRDPNSPSHVGPVLAGHDPARTREVPCGGNLAGGRRDGRRECDSNRQVCGPHARIVSVRHAVAPPTGENPCEVCPRAMASAARRRACRPTDSMRCSRSWPRAVAGFAGRPGLSGVQAKYEPL
jgi:hypothetical protein